MFIIMIAAALLVVLALEFFYLRSLVGRVLAFWHLDTEQKKIKIIKYAIILCIMGMSAPVFTMVGLGTLHVVAIGAIIDLICLLIRLIIRKKPKFLNIISSCGIIPLGVSIIIYGYINMHNVVKTEYTVETQKELERDYTVAFVSDVHMGVSLGIEELEAVAKEISACYPDILLLGGDIVDESTTYEEMEKVFKAFGNVETTFGIYFVYGNHDEQNYSSSAEYTTAQLENAITKAGIQILKDEAIEINNDIVLVGRLDASFKGDKKKSERDGVEALTKPIDKNKLILLLDHQPREYESDKKAGVDLVISGHTHGGQIWPGGLLTTLIAPNELNYGHIQDGSFQAIVSSGIAGWGFPIKTSKYAEYLIVTICEK